ncbi:MAG: hypothetical protein K8H74_19930, partial [Notoacmeibacter sp.]|nr:hypothetical protein [Notoacmeibacter sp.]
AVFFASALRAFGRRNVHWTFRRQTRKTDLTVEILERRSSRCGILLADTKNPRHQTASIQR